MSDPANEGTEVDLTQKSRALWHAANHDPLMGATIVVLSLLTALLEGVGIGFILPILEFSQTSTPATDSDGVMQVFTYLYSLVGVPFTLEYLLAGLAVTMAVRFGLSFCVEWLRGRLNVGYQQELRQRLFEGISNGPIGYIDRTGSDELLNSIVTEANKAGGIISMVISIVESTLRGLIYLVIASILSPVLTTAAILGLGVSTLVVRFVLEPAYTVGDEIADANSRIQSASQAAIQGSRDVRLFNLRPELVDEMRGALDQFATAGVRLKRNQAAMRNANRFINAMVVFVLVYAGVRYTTLSLAEIGVFLFAVFRLSPVVTQLNNLLYSLDGTLPHIVRVQQRIQDLESLNRPVSGGDRSVSSIGRLEFDDVSFSYDGGERVLHDVSFAVQRGEKVALVGQSGAGKSTIISLLGRFHEPDSGTILADGTPIEEFDVTSWRDRVSVVRQDPYIFDETLWENLTIGNRNASREAVEEACEAAQVTEFLDELPEGYETELNENAVRLSGGQKQRVAIARALLKEADVLLFDEATSELDAAIERRVYRGIRELPREFAFISIAHRLSTVSDAERIYTLVDGTVVESGSHEELLSNGATYSELYEMQQ